MEESNRDIADQFESSLFQSKTKIILLEGKHRWLRPDEICEVLRNPNEITIYEEPTFMPESGSIFLFDKNVQKHFRKDGYRWKKAKDGKIKEAHEKLKVEGHNTLHCYYAHGEEDQTFQRRCYWMLEENLSHMVLVHYRDIKGEKRKAIYKEETETAEGVQHSCKTDEITPNSDLDSYLELFDITPDISHLFVPTNCNGREVKEAVSSCFVPTNFQVLLEAIDIEDAQSDGFFNNTVTTGFSEIGPSFEMGNFGSPSLHTTSLYGANSSNFGDDETAWTYSRASSSVAVEPSPLGKRKRDSTASEEGKSQATHNVTMEEVDKEKDEEEEGNDINQVWKRPKVTCGQKSNSVAPSNDSEEATLAVGTAPPQVEVIAENNPTASDVAVAIDRAITDSAMNDATALSQANVDVSNVVVVSSVHVEGTTTSVPPAGVDVAMAPMDVQAPIGVLPEPLTYPEKTIKGDGVSLNGARTSEVVPPHVVLSPEKQASIEEWASWHEAFNTLKDSIRNSARVLSSIKELLPQGEAFTSHVDFRNTKVRYGLADILNRFLERVGDADERLIDLSPYMREIVFEELGILLYDMEHTPPVEVSEHRLLCWRDMINDVAALGVPVSSLIETLEKSRDSMFGLHLEEDKGILDQFVKVNELERVLELQRKELEAEKLKLKKLVRGSSKEIADCLQIAADHLSAGTSGAFRSWRTI